MPKQSRKLTEMEIKNAKAQKKKAYKLYDENSLCLLVRTSGTKVWQLPYKYLGKYNVYTIGQYPETGSAEARKERDRIKALLREGINPNLDKEAKKQENIGEHEKTFKFIAEEWLGKQTWIPKHKKNIQNSFQKDVFPKIGNRQINKISPADIIKILEVIEGRDAPDIAKRICQHTAKIFDYAINKELCSYNPAQGRAGIIKSIPVTHRPYLKEDQLPEFLNKLEDYRGGQLVKLALKLLLLTFVRPGELRFAHRQEIDINNAIWRISANRMKMRRDHIVPLSKQALGVIQEILAIIGNIELLFPSPHGSEKPISDVTLLKAIQIMGYIGDKKIVPHGMRATASTILNEHGFKRDAIERQLGHIEGNKVRAAYHHSEYLAERKVMMQWYADYLDKLKANYKPAKTERLYAVAS